MQRFRRTVLAWLSVVALTGVLVGPASMASAQTSGWQPGPGAILDNTYDGFIDVPSAGATVPTGGFTVSGWFVDKMAQGWAGADDVQVWQGTMDGGGTMLAKANFAQSRPDVANALGNPFWAASGFNAFVAGGQLSDGPLTLSVYAHTPGKGWWFKQVQVNASSSAPAAAAPSAPSGSAPTVSGGAPPVVVIVKPKGGAVIKTNTASYETQGYALDPNASPQQGSQGTGIDHVTLYMDAERDSGGTFLGEADLAFQSDTAAAQYGSQFAASGWRLSFKPTKFKAKNHTLFVYAHSVVTGKENFVTVNFDIKEP